GPSAQEAKAGLYRQLYRRLTQSWISRYANVGLGCSNCAAADLFGSKWESDRRWQILYYGIDLTPFREAIDKEAIRRELGIPSDAFVIGHVGRFVAQKNHEFLIQIAAEVAKREPKMHLLLLGEGELRSQIQRQVEQMGLSDRVTFAGSRPDIPRLMRGAIDVFLLPSLFEGLPVVGIEAQAAGLPFILSDTITPEVEIFKPLVRWLSLSQPASAWAEIVLNHRDAGDAIAQSEALKVVETSLFNIEVSVKQLEGIFQEALV
ncbi:MAG TPA: glycosyltransferase, partial [Cyanobacteria bacterium UBA11368]|nr:glycosyltransferase [Cyanobacteria bacterium UBA11368]